MLRVVVGGAFLLAGAFFKSRNSLACAQALLSPLPHSPLVPKALSAASHEFLTAFTDFVREFYVSHAPTLETLATFPLSDVLRLWTEYTLAQPSLPLIMQCLRFWVALCGRAQVIVLDVDSDDGDGMPAPAAPAAPSGALAVYVAALNALSALLFDHVQFCKNRAFLLRLEDDDDDGDGSSGGDTGGSGGTAARAAEREKASANSMMEALEDELEDWMSAGLAGLADDDDDGGDDSDGDGGDGGEASGGASLDAYVRLCVTVVLRTAQLPGGTAGLLRAVVPLVNGGLRDAVVAAAASQVSAFATLGLGGRRGKAVLSIARIGLGVLT